MGARIVTNSITKKEQIQRIREILSSDNFNADQKIELLKESKVEYFPPFLELLKEGDQKIKREILAILPLLKDQRFVKTLKKLINSARDYLSLKIMASYILEELDKKEKDESQTLDFENASNIKAKIEDTIKNGGIERSDWTRDSSRIAELFNNLPLILRLSILKELIDTYREHTFPFISKTYDKKDMEEDLIENIAFLKSEEAARLLKEALKRAREKRTIRSIKKALYWMKQAGISIPQEDSKEEILIRRPDFLFFAYASGFDSFGDRILFLAKRTSPQNIFLYQIVINYIKGIKDFLTFRIGSRKDWELFLEESKKEGKLPVDHMEIPQEYGLYLLKEAYERTAEEKTPLKEDVKSLQYLVDHAPIQEGFFPPVYDAASLKDLKERDDLWKKGDSLHEIEGINAWLIDKKDIEVYLERIRKIEGSPIILLDHQKISGFKEVYGQAAEELFDKKRRAFYKRRLEDTAYLFLRRNMLEEAKIALAAALSMEREDIEASNNPFLHAMITKSISFYLARAEIEEKEKNLIIKPYEHNQNNPSLLSQRKR